MTTYQELTIPNRATFEPENKIPPVHVTLRWRQQQLLVSRAPSSREPSLPPLSNEQWLVECLEHSPIKLLRVDATLGEESLNFWANACEKANKPVFLRLPPSAIRQQHVLVWRLYRLIEASIAALLLLLLSPVIVGLIVLLRRRSPQPIFCQQWHVGDRGKLLRLFNLRTTENLRIQCAGSVHREDWISKYKLDKLPQLFNILRGEISLIKSRPLTLEQAVKLSSEKRQVNFITN